MYERRNWILLVSLSVEFNIVIEFIEAQIMKWLVMFINDNKDQLGTIKQLWFDAHNLEEEIFALRVKKDIIVLAMKEYSEEWIRKSLNEIIDLD